MVTRAKQATAGRGGAPVGSSTAPAVDPATYVPNFSRSPASWRPNGGNLVDSLTFVQLLSDRPGRTTFIVVNTGSNPVLICSDSTGDGAISIGPTGSYNIDTEGELWAAVTAAGSTTVDVTETYGAVPQNEIRRPKIPGNAWGLR